MLHLVQASRAASNSRTSLSLLDTSMLGAPEAPMKTSMPFVMLLSLVLTRKLHSATQTLCNQAWENIAGAICGLVLLCIPPQQPVH